MGPLDLTLTISKSLPTFPGSPVPQFISWSNLKKDGYNLELLFLSSHTGTHIDAPYHFAENGKKIHEISLKRLTGNATLIKLERASNESISKSDIVTHEKQNGKIPNYSSVFFFTGWQKNLKKKQLFYRKSWIEQSSSKIPCF